MAMRVTQDQRIYPSVTRTTKPNGNARNSVRGQQNRYLTFCDHNAPGYSLKPVTLPTFKFMEKPLDDNEMA